MRLKWFSAWLSKNSSYTKEEILQFQLFARDGDEHTQVKMRIYGVVKTVSITCIELDSKEQSMYYSDLKEKENYVFKAWGFDGLTRNSIAGKIISIPAK